MSVKAAKKLGFFASLCMLVGTVVGVGIFFKSHGVLSANDWNGIGTLLAWILGGLLSLGAAVSFSEIGSLKTGKVSGLGAHAEIVVNQKFGYFTRFNYSFFYFGMLSVVMSFFTTEAIVSIFTTLNGGAAADVPVYGHVLIALALLVVLQLLNYVSLKASGTLQQVTTVLKWIPLVLVAVLGIGMATVNNWPYPDSEESYGVNAFVNEQSFTFTGMLASLPAVLFAYDAFLNVTSISHKIKGGVKKVSLIVIVGMVSIVVLYTLIGLAACLHGSGMVSGAPFGYDPSEGKGIFDQIFSAEVAKVFGQITIVFLAVAALGTTNGLCAAGQAVMMQCVETNTFFGVKTLKQRFSIKTVDLIWIYGIYFFWALVVFVPAIGLNTDAYVDGISNFSTLFFFPIYAMVILHYTLKRGKYANPKINDTLFKVFAWIAIVGIFLLAAYQLVYNFFFQTLIQLDWDPSWGLFVNNEAMVGWQATTLFFCSLAIFFLFPCLNWFLTKKFEDNEVIVDTQTLERPNLSKDSKPKNNPTAQ